MDMAILRLAHVVQLDPDNRSALTCLCDALRAQGHLETLAGLLEWWASATSDKASAAGALTEASSIRERLGQSAEYALTLLRRALRLEPTHAAALRKMAAMLRARGDHARLLNILTAHLSELREPEHKKARAYFARELAHVHLRHTGNLDAAIDALEEAFVSAPLDRRIALELARAYASRSRQDRKQDRARADRKLAVHLYTQLAEVSRHHAARAMCIEALDLCPQSIEALCILERHARSQDRALMRARYEAFLAVGPSPYALRVRQRLIDTLLESGDYEGATSHVSALSPAVGALGVERDVVRACSVLPPPPDMDIEQDIDVAWNQQDDADCYEIVVRD